MHGQNDIKLRNYFEVSRKHAASVDNNKTADERNTKIKNREEKAGKGKKEHEEVKKTGRMKQK